MGRSDICCLIVSINQDPNENILSDQFTFRTTERGWSYLVYVELDKSSGITYI